MPKAGIHCDSSTNWNLALAESKLTQMNSDSRKLIIDVHNATLRALRATTSASPRMVRMNSAPTSGRKVNSDRIGNCVMIRSSRVLEQIPRDQDDDARQHGERVMVEIAG